MAKARLTWDDTGKKVYETGVRNGVVYPYNSKAEAFTVPTSVGEALTKTDSKYGPGVAWNGLTGVTVSPSGAEATDLWADDIKYVSIRSAEEVGGTIEAYTYPPEFAVLDGSASPTGMPGVVIGQQSRGSFGFCFRTTVGNDTEYENYGYKIQLMYGCTVSPSEKAYQTINDSPEAITFSWELETTPVNVTKIEGAKPTATLVIDTTALTEAQAKNLPALLDCLYGTESSDPFLPLPDEVIDILNHSEAV